MMMINIATKEDLIELKKELLEELTKLLGAADQKPKKWLRSLEVRKMLSISPGTLQNLRINGQLKFTKVGGIMYYDASDIEKMMGQSPG